MHIPTFWARAHLDVHGRVDPNGPAQAFGWSEESREAAVAYAMERAARVAAMLRAGRDGELRRTWQYYPLDRPLCEPVLDRLDGGVLTRNQYGAVVLNTERAAFVDVDLPAPAPVGWLDKLFGRRPPPAPDVEGRVREVAERGHGIRLYRTAAGYRALVTSRPLPVGRRPRPPRALRGLARALRRGARESVGVPARRWLR